MEEVQVIDCPPTPGSSEVLLSTTPPSMSLLDMLDSSSSAEEVDNCTGEADEGTTESGRSSPPPKCAICLGKCRQKCYTDSCRHQFCYRCLLEWSKIKAECPLCKQVFRSIIYDQKNRTHHLSAYNATSLGIFSCRTGSGRASSGLPPAGLYPVPAATFYLQRNTSRPAQPERATPAAVSAPIRRRATVQPRISRRHHSFQTKRTRVETVHLPSEITRETAGGRQRKTSRMQRFFLQRKPRPDSSSDAVDQSGANCPLPRQSVPGDANPGGLSQPADVARHHFAGVP